MPDPNTGAFLKSYAYRSTDVGAIPDALMRGFSVVVIVDTPDMNAYPGCYPMSGLLPPPVLVYNILNTELKDPNYQEIVRNYKAGYYDFLATPDREKYMVNLIASMYKTTKPILIYTELDIERQFYVLEVLSMFMYNQFGIGLGEYESLYNPQSPPPSFTPDPRFIGNIIDLLFTNAYISKEEFSLLLPDGRIPSYRAVSILLSDFDYVFPTMEESLQAACNIVMTYRQQITTGKFCPAVRFKQKLDEARQKQINEIVMNANTRFGTKTLAEINATKAAALQQPQQKQ